MNNFGKYRYSPEEEAAKRAAAEQHASQQVLDAWGRAWRWFSGLVAFRPGDNAFQMAYKILLRGVGILVFIALSPLYIIGLLFAISLVL